MSISSTSLTHRRSAPGAIRARARSRLLTPLVTTKSSPASDNKRPLNRRLITTTASSWYRASSEVEAMATSAQMNETNENLTQTRQAILQAEQEIFTAIKNQDTSALERILADDFVY